MEREAALQPDSSLKFKRPINLVAFGREFWKSLELVRTLAERELRARYKQAILGISWAVIVPVILMIVFTVFLRKVAEIDTRGAPYPLFSYLGLLPWTFFSTSILQGGQSLVNNSSLLNKIYCPREVFPTASVVVAGIDALISTGILLILFVITGFGPKATSVYAPIYLLILISFSLGTAYIVSAILIYFRDLRHALPILLQLGLFATPVAYPIRLEAPLDLVYAAVNPLSVVLDGYRSTILFGETPDWTLVGIAGAAAALILVGGYAFFKRVETGFADVA